VGSFVLRSSGQGAVVSVHPGAVNVLIEEGLLLSFVAHRRDLTALAVLAPELVEARPSVGAAVTRRGDALQVGGTQVPLAGVPVWRGRLHRRDLGSAHPGLAALLGSALQASGKPGGLLGLLGPGGAAEAHGRGNPFAERTAAVLRRAAEANDSATLPGLEALVGLGPGFTPSGDDFLTGALLGERAAHLAGREAPRIDAGAIAARIDRSSAGGRTLLWLALRGSFPAYLLAAWRALSRARTPEAVRAAVVEAAAHGETSGTDALVGLRWYLQRL
jgi:hypothetical protein